jgi:outer membrane lipoprotein-sorting protein
MNRRLFVLSLMLLPLSASAQSRDNPLLPLRARLAGFNVVRAEFSQFKEIAAMKRPARSAGRVVISREHGIWWQIEKPLRIGYVLQAHRIVEIGSDGTRRERSVQDQPGLGQVARIFRALLSAQDDTLLEYFDVETLPDAEGWTLELKPRQPQLAQYLRSITLGGDAFVEYIYIKETSGDSTSIHFQDSRGGMKLEPAEAQVFGAP